MTFESITHEKNERFCPIIGKNVLMDIHERKCNGCTITNIKCSNEEQCIKQFGRCTNNIIQ